MALRQAAAKKFAPAQSDTIYKKAYRMKFRSDDILQPTLRDFLELYKVRKTWETDELIDYLWHSTMFQCVIQ